MANGNELREFANQLRSEENLSTSQIQRDPRYIAKQEEIAEQREQQLDQKANIEAKNLFNVVNNIDNESIISSVANEYFDLNNLEPYNTGSEKNYRTHREEYNSMLDYNNAAGIVKETQIGQMISLKPELGGRQKLTPELRDEIISIADEKKRGFQKKFANEEEYDDYLKSFYKDRYDEYILFKDKNEIVKNEQTDLLTDKYKFEQKNKNIEQYLRSVDEDVRDKIDIEDLTGFNSFEQGDKFIKDQSNLYKNSIEENNENYLTYKNDVKVFSDKVDVIDKELSKIAASISTYGTYVPVVIAWPDSGGDFEMDAFDSPKRIEQFNKLITDRNKLISEYQPSLTERFNDIKSQSESLGFMLQNIKNKNSQLNDAAIIANALSKDYSLSARSAQAFEEFFLGSGAEFVGLTSKVLTKMLQKTGGGSLPGQIITKGLDYIDNLTEGEVNEMFDMVGNYALNHATNYNEKLAKKREVNLPAPITLDDIGNNKIGYSDWLGEAFANNSPSILVGTLGAGAAVGSRVILSKAANKTRSLVLSPKYKSEITLNAKKKALKYNRLAMDTTIGTFFVGETGDRMTDIELGQRTALDILPEKRKQLFVASANPNSFEAKNLSQQIKDLERISNYSLAQKALTSYGSGGFAAAFERLPLKFLQEASQYGLKFGPNQFKKEIYGKIPNFTLNLLGNVGKEGGKVLLRGGTIEQLEELGTEVSHNALDIFVLGENKSMLSGIDKEFLANNFVTIGAITAPKIAMNMQQALANEFTIRDEVLNQRKLRLELDNIRIDIKNSEGQELLDKRKRKNEILQELALLNATSIQKLNSMTSEQIEEAADIKRQMRELDKLAGRIGGAGKTGANSDAELKKIIEEYNFLEEKLETLLSSKKNKVRKGIDDFKKEYANKLGFDVKSGPDAAYHLGLYDFYKDAAGIMLPKNGEYIEYTDGELTQMQPGGNVGFNLTNFEAIENKLKEKGIDQAAIDEIKVRFSEGANAAQAGNNIIINEKALIKNILEGSKGDAKYAAIAPLEELSHIRNRAYGLVDKDGQMTEKGKKAVEEAVKVLNEKKELNRIKEDDYNALIRRLNAYEGDSEEILEQIKNAVVLGLLDISDIETMYGFQDFVRGFVGDVFGEYSWMFDLSDSNDVFRFAKNFKRQVETQQVIASAPEDQEEAKLSKPVAETSMIKQELGDKMNDVVGYDSNTTNDQFKNSGAVNFYINYISDEAPVETRNLLDNLIKKRLRRLGIATDKDIQGQGINPNVHGYDLNPFLEEVKMHLYEGTVRRFNPKINDDFAGFLASELDFRIGNISNKYKKGPKTSSLDVPAGDVGSVATPVADDTTDIEAEQDIVSELKQGLKINNEQFVDESLDTELQTNTLEIIEGVTPETDSKDLITYLKDASQQKSFKTIKNKLKNLNEVLQDNYKVLFHGKNLPIATLVALERQLPVEERIFTGEPTRLTTQAQIDKAVDEGDFHVENEKQGPMKYPRKKPTIEQVLKFANPPAINPKTGKPSGLKGTRKDGIVNAIAFSLFRDYAPETMNRANIDARDIAKVSQRLIVDPTIKFSKAVGDIINIRSLFELETNGIDKLLDLYGQNSTFDIKSDTGRAEFIEFVKSDLLPLMPKEFWFNYDKDGNVTSSAFTYSNASYGLSMSKNEDGSFKNVDQATAYENFKNEIFTIGKNFTNFGKPIQGVDWTLTKNYTTIFGKKGNFVDKIQQGIKHGDIDKWNKNVGIIHREMWSRFNNVISKDKDGVVSGGVGTYLKLVANDKQAWHRLGAQIAGYSSKITSREGGKNENIEFEHAMPATAAYLYLMDSILSDSDFNTSYDLIIKNYKLIVLDKAMDDKLKNARTKKGYSLQRRMPDGWSVIEGNWWQRYFNYIVYAQKGGIDPDSVIDINTGKTFAETFNIDAAGRSTNKNIENSKEKAFNKNPKSKFSKAINNDGLLNDLNNYDKAMRNARDLNAPRKGISIFDFDDTLATSKSKVIVTVDDKTTKITPAEFAKQHSKLEEQGAEFDFSEFNKVVDGKPGPLAAKLKKAIDKFGNKDVFVLTARPQASAQAIYDFLKGIGLEVPLENITGLEDGTPQAKANWVVSKAAEGYNDFYFTDDVYKNVKAVQDVLEVLDVKSKTRLAYSDRVKKLDKDFNDILEAKTGIASEKEYSKAKAQVVGANKGKFNFFIPPSAEDFVGLLYSTLGKGKLGDSQMAWYKKNLLDPYASAMAAISKERIGLMDDYKALKNQLGIVPKNLRKKIPGETFTNEQALRVYIWNKQGMTIPGLSNTDLKELTDYIESKPEFKIFGDQLIAINKGDGYAAPTSGWLAGTITTDLTRGLGTTKRVKHLEQWQQNVDIIFSEKNLNKLEAAFGKPYRVALEGILQRMKTGRNRSFTGDSKTGKLVDWLTNSIGTIMFFNTRSALLQTISAVNFVNFSDNNIFKAGKAYANQKQYWSDFMTLMNSEFLIDRRRGLRINVNEADIANMASQSGARGVIAKMLEIGFLPTQIADSFAIASGGATFYRNRINSYKKQGLSDQQAQEKAFNDFREIAEESQQSSRPDRISQEQAGPLGRIILAFANTPMQYARLIKKAASDLKNRRGDVKTNISKIIYYGFVQNLIFNGLQQALFAIAFGDIDDEEDQNEKYINTANNMADSLLRGSGLTGAYFSVGKNIVMRVIKESQKDNPKYEKASFDLARLSPPISSKLSRINQAGRAFQWEKDEMRKKGFSIDNPALMASANVISAATNIPIDRLVRKANNVNTALSQDLQLWERFALMGGWQDWELGIDDEPEKSKEKTKFGETRQTRKRIIRKRIN